MGKNVFANGMEISAKASDNKSIASMPDVCLSPPSPPAGPLPIPYPNFGNASDTDKGSKRVKIGNKPTGQKNSSNYKKSKGDIAATKAQGMGLIVGGIEGPVYFGAWSMDVKIEGKNVPRFMDLTTGNHGSIPPNTANITTSVAGGAPPASTDHNCEELQKANDTKDEEIENALKSDKTKKAAEKQKKHPATTVSTADCTCKGKRVMAKASAYSSTSSFNETTKKMLRLVKPIKTRLVNTTEIDPNTGELKKTDTGRTKKEREKPESNMCKGESGEPHVYENNGAGNSCSHTEAAFLEELWSEGKGERADGCEMTIAIKWKQRGQEQGNKSVPCGECDKALCRAQECGLKINLCKKGKKEEYKCKSKKKPSGKKSASKKM